jgi:hypothetical protein
MTAPTHLELVLHLLDHSLVDCNDCFCGQVDDIELSGDFGSPLRVSALLVGPGAWGPRLPRLFEWLAARLFGTGRVRVPFDQIAEIAEHIKLKSTAGALGLGKLDRKAGRWLKAIPGSEKAH